MSDKITTATLGGYTFDPPLVFPINLIIEGVALMIGADGFINGDLTAAQHVLSKCKRSMDGTDNFVLALLAVAIRNQIRETSK